MVQSQTKSQWSAKKTLLVAVLVSAILGSATGFSAGYLARPAPPATNREFFVFAGTASFNDTLLSQTFNQDLPHDIFLPDQIVVNKGDSVTIHFYNTEDEPENHTFTMGAPYAVDRDLAMQQKADITFVANNAGLFKYVCTYHLPTMTGYLVVLG